MGLPAVALVAFLCYAGLPRLAAACQAEQRAGLQTAGLMLIVRVARPESVRGASARGALRLSTWQTPSVGAYCWHLKFGAQPGRALGATALVAMAGLARLWLVVPPAATRW